MTPDTLADTAQSQIMPTLSAEEHEGLEKPSTPDGVLTPVGVDEDGMGRAEIPHVERIDAAGRRQPASKAKPKRRPIADAFKDATYTLLKEAIRLDRLGSDERFMRDSSASAGQYLADLQRASDALTKVIEQLHVTAEAG